MQPIPGVPVDLRNTCPGCGQTCHAVKARSYVDIAFFLFGASHRTVTVFGCADCVRAALRQNLLLGLVKANLIWPFLVLPNCLFARLGLGKPGHDARWIERTGGLRRR